jgi:hypothetical protein
MNQPSKLFPQLFRHCTKGQRVHVLDVGRATPGTVDFFSGFPCKIHFKDLFASPLLHELAQVEPSIRRKSTGSSSGKSEKGPEKDIDLRAGFAELLSFPEGTKFDICLFWDLLNFLSAPAVRAFGEALRPWIHHRTRGHGFGVHNVEVKLQHRQYSIAGVEGFHVTESGETPLRYHPHAQTDLYDLLGHMGIERGVLLADGKVEFLLKTTF